MELEKINDSIDIGNLFLVRDGTRLAKEGGKLESLADGSLGEVNVKLFTILGR